MKDNNLTDLHKKDLLGTDTAAEFLGISKATVKNWIRHGYLTPEIIAGRQAFHLSEIQSLKEKILNGNIDRLNKRANKRSAAKSFIPAEYLETSSYRTSIENILAVVRQLDTDLNTAVYLLAVNLLIREGVILVDDPAKIFSFNEIYFSHKRLMSELNHWHTAIDYSYCEHHRDLLSAELPLQQDILGLVYQSLLSEGEKVRKGAYYTPQAIVNKVFEDAGFFESEGANMKILDPCCGTGQFLLAVPGNVSPLNLYGIDTDSIAVRIARINLLLKYRSVDFMPLIYCGNSLTEFEDSLLFPLNSSMLGSFDLITTNPPWGLHLKKRDLEHLGILYPEIKSSESFSYMLRKSLDFLKEGGRLSFILPESILNVSAHKWIRHYILNNTRIAGIEFLDRLFRNVFTGAVKMDLIKDSSNSAHGIIVIKDDMGHVVNQDRLRENRDFVFDIHVRDEDAALLKKVFSVKHTTLKDNTDWALGIVTGDNKRFLSDKCLDGYEPVIRGRDIEKFVIPQTTAFIKYDPDQFQQVAPMDRYWAKEKLVYRFISGSLVFAYDDQRRLTLNSANILIPHDGFYPIKVIMALFNSSLYNFIYAKKYSSIKILKTHLEELPLPLWDSQTMDIIEMMVQQIMQTGTGYDELDDLIMDKFGLSRSEKEHIIESMRPENKTAGQVQ